MMTTARQLKDLIRNLSKNYYYTADISRHIIMEFIRDLYQTGFSDKFKADFL